MIKEKSKIRPAIAWFEDNLFLIDSENLDSVKTKFYGFVINKDGILTDRNLPIDPIELSGRGCYINVDVSTDRIMIRQDFMGSWGLYIFRNDDYFALSNSFFYLLSSQQ